MTMLESEIERKLGKEIKKLGGLYYKFTSPNLPGVPDRIIIMPGGRIIFAELKTTVGRLSNVQKWVISEMEKRNADVRVIKGWPEAQSLIEELRQYSRKLLCSTKGVPLMLSQNLQRARKKARITQADLAEILGVNRATISKYENGEITPSFKMLLRIVDTLSIDPRELIANPDDSD